MNTPNGAGGRDDDIRQLRGKIDSDDKFFPGHGIKTGSPEGSRHATRIQKTPRWTKSDKGIQTVLLRVFPKLLTDNGQRRRAAIWARIIYLYYRSGYTYREIAEEMNLKSSSEKRPFAKVEMILERVKFAAKGLATRLGTPRKQRGRPKKFAM